MFFIFKPILLYLYSVMLGLFTLQTHFPSPRGSDSAKRISNEEGGESGSSGPFLSWQHRPSNSLASQQHLLECQLLRQSVQVIIPQLCPHPQSISSPLLGLKPRISSLCSLGPRKRAASCTSQLCVVEVSYTGFVSLN